MRVAAWMVGAGDQRGASRTVGAALAEHALQRIPGQGAAQFLGCSEVQEASSSVVGNTPLAARGAWPKGV